jgi:hypothetical protein
MMGKGMQACMEKGMDGGGHGFVSKVIVPIPAKISFSV